MTFFESVILGAIEGLTEFLPVSSTGHLILASKLLGIDQNDFHKSFEVVIQLGSILAVIFLYHQKIFHSLGLWKRLMVAFLPAGILGFLFYKTIKNLFSPLTVSLMLIIGGVAFLVLEYLYKEKEHQLRDVEKIPYIKAFAIGLFQSLAMIPGTSRSGATILGGILLGLERKTAAEFSFLLAVPTMIIASAYDILKHYETFNTESWGVLGIGFVTAFFVASIAIKTFVAFISRFSFVPFGIYRIVVGIIFLFFVL